jgi:DNA-binding transcriptional LysR family regulator
MNLSLRDIEYFLAVVEHGNLDRAAAACGVSQPALSKSLQPLEADTGLALLDRGGRGLRLTSAGLAFREHAQRLWAEYRDPCAMRWSCAWARPGCCVSARPALPWTAW